MKEFTISKNDAGQRMDKFRTKAIPTLPSSLLYKYIRLKRIKLNGKRCEISTRLSVGDVVQCYVSAPNGKLGKAAKVLAAFAIYFIGVWLIRKTKKILGRIFERNNTDAAIASFVQSIAGIALTVVLIVVTVGALGIDTTSIAALLAGGGMAIGMALNGTVQNFAGGIMIIVFKPFKAGDFIEAQGYTGTVTEVSITSTKLLTTDNRAEIGIKNIASFN